MDARLLKIIRRIMQNNEITEKTTDKYLERYIYYCKLAGIFHKQIQLETFELPCY